VELRWHDRAFGELSVAELYAIIALRERVFVVEQACLYLDADGLDPVCRHLWAAGETIVAYLRIVPAGVNYDEVALGRIVTAPDARGTGLGRTLVRRGPGPPRAVLRRLRVSSRERRLPRGRDPAPRDAAHAVTSVRCANCAGSARVLG
jgi:GNAT superfamily N-acetyltransferase